MEFNNVGAWMPLIELRALLAFTKRGTTQHATHRPDRLGFVFFDSNVGIAGAFDDRRLLFAPAKRTVDPVPWRPFGAGAGQIDRLIRTHRANAVFGREAMAHLELVADGAEFVASFHRSKYRVDATRDISQLTSALRAYGSTTPSAKAASSGSFDPRDFADVDLVRRARVYAGEVNPPVVFLFPAEPTDPLRLRVGADPATAWHVVLMPRRFDPSGQ